jgi:hypothetical protein
MRIEDLGDFVSVSDLGNGPETVIIRKDQVVWIWAFQGSINIYTRGSDDGPGWKDLSASDFAMAVKDLTRALTRTDAT